MSKTNSRLSSGKNIDLAAITVDDIVLSDINTSLNWQYRFNGHHKDNVPLTVAQHTKLAMQIADIMYHGDLSVQMDVLLHDMPEAYYGDITSPIKQIVKEQLKPYCEAVDAVLYDKLWPVGIAYDGSIHDARVVCDLASLDMERRTMWLDQRGKEHWSRLPEVKYLTVKDKQEMFADVQAERFVDLPAMYEELLEKINRQA